MALNAQDLKAIAWYAQTNNLRVQLSTPPTMYFTKRTTGERVTELLSNIHTLFKNQPKGA